MQLLSLQSRPDSEERARRVLLLLLRWRLLLLRRLKGRWKEEQQPWKREGN
jgi:hypothetical protein